MSVSKSIILQEMSSLPRDKDGPVFAEPWQAQAFALAVQLHEAACFTWPEFADYLSAVIAKPQNKHEEYYHCWLTALEDITMAKSLASSTELSNRKAQWHAAALATPHGEPIELKNGC